MTVTRYRIPEFHTRKDYNYNFTAKNILNNDVGVPWQSSIP